MTAPSRANPESFSDSYVCSSWLQYLSSMSMIQTWADNIIIQAVADSMNLSINNNNNNNLILLLHAFHEMIKRALREFYS